MAWDIRPWLECLIVFARTVAEKRATMSNSCFISKDQLIQSIGLLWQWRTRTMLLNYRNCQYIANLAANQTPASNMNLSAAYWSHWMKLVDKWLIFSKSHWWTLNKPTKKIVRLTWLILVHTDQSQQRAMYTTMLCHTRPMMMMNAAYQLIRNWIARLR